MDEERHIPGQTDAEITVEEQKPLTDEAPKEPEAETPKEPAADDKDKTPETPAEDPEKSPEPLKVTKPRSIYDDYKDKKQEAKDTTARAEAAEARAAEHHTGRI